MFEIDVELVKRLIRSQFPEWQNLSIKPVKKSGWDNRTFHLGNETCQTTERGRVRFTARERI